MTLNGIEVLLSEHLVETATREEPRTWRDRLVPSVMSAFPRLFAYWCPWKATRPVTFSRPMRGGLMLRGKLVMHPQTFNEMKRLGGAR